VRCRTDHWHKFIDDKFANICLNTIKKEFTMQTEQLTVIVGVVEGVGLGFLAGL
jgi:hypothetical protein